MRAYFRDRSTLRMNVSWLLLTQADLAPRSQRWLGSFNIGGHAVRSRAVLATAVAVFSYMMERGNRSRLESEWLCIYALSLGPWCVIVHCPRALPNATNLDRDQGAFNQRCVVTRVFNILTNHIGVSALSLRPLQTWTGPGISSEPCMVIVAHRTTDRRVLSGEFLHCTGHP